MANVLFISESTLKERTYISDNVDIKYLRETILYCQDVHIQRLIGTTLYELIKTQITANTLTAVNTTLLTDYIHPILIWRVTAESAYWSSNKLMNKGVMQQSSENSQLASSLTIANLKSDANDKAEFYEQRMVDYLCENETLYPTYANPDSGVDVIQPLRGNVFTSPIYLGEPHRDGKSMRTKYRDEQFPI
jgi:hypothetical protein